MNVLGIIWTVVRFYICISSILSDSRLCVRPYKLFAGGEHGGLRHCHRRIPIQVPEVDVIEQSYGIIKICRYPAQFLTNLLVALQRLSAILGVTLCHYHLIAAPLETAISFQTLCL